MTNHELLDMIGEVKEDYVEEADGHVVRPRFRWKALAGLAACAALVAAYPLYRAVNPPLHDYAVMEGSSEVMADLADGQAKAPAGDAAGGPAADGGVSEVPPVLSAPAAPEAAPAEPGEAAAGRSGKVAAKEGENAAGAGGAEGADAEDAAIFGEQDKAAPGPDIAANSYSAPASEQAQEYPAWFGGSWIDHDDNPSRLSVAIVDGFRTPELEAEIRARYGGQEILLPTVKYSLNELTKLRDDVTRLFEELDYRGYLGYGVRQMENRVHIDLSEEPSGQLLSALAELDPDGDAILVQVFQGASISPDGDVPLSTPGGAEE